MGEPTTGIRKSSNDATLLLVINGHTNLVQFTLPECSGGLRWSLLVDTNVSDLEAKGTHNPKDTYAVTSRSLLLFVLET
jgi:isoamylase